MKGPVGVRGEVGMCATLRILDFMSYNFVILREFLGVEDGCNHKCRVIQKIGKTLSSSTHTTTQKRTESLLYNERCANGESIDSIRESEKCTEDAYKCLPLKFWMVNGAFGQGCSCNLKMRWRFLELSLFILIAEYCQSSNLL